MARNPDRNGKRPEQSAISAHQTRLTEEDARIKAEEARLTRMLEAAPMKREELVRKQRDEFIKRKTKVVHLDGPIDRRFEALPVPRTGRTPKMRKDRTFSQLLSVILLVSLCLALYYAFRVMGGK